MSAFNILAGKQPIITLLNEKNVFFTSVYELIIQQ